jgi:hypothetical protein
MYSKSRPEMGGGPSQNGAKNTVCTTPLLPVINLLIPLPIQGPVISSLVFVRIFFKRNRLNNYSNSRDSTVNRFRFIDQSRWSDYSSLGQDSSRNLNESHVVPEGLAGDPPTECTTTSDPYFPTATSYALANKSARSVLPQDITTIEELFTILTGRVSETIDKSIAKHLQQWSVAGKDQVIELKKEIEGLKASQILETAASEEGRPSELPDAKVPEESVEKGEEMPFEGRLSPQQYLLTEDSIALPNLLVAMVGMSLSNRRVMEGMIKQRSSLLQQLDETREQFELKRQALDFVTDNLRNELRTRRQELLEVKEQRSSLEQKLADTKRQLECKSQDFERAFTESECLRESELQLMRERLQLSDSLETGQATRLEQPRMSENMHVQVDNLLLSTNEDR